MRRAAKRRQPLFFGIVRYVSMGLALLPWGEPITRERKVYGWRRARPDVAPF
jgi:hypothetical protein